MSVRISAHDWAPGGNTPDDAVEIARLFKAAGADLIDVSSGQVSKQQQPVYGRMYQTPFADRIRNEVGHRDHRGGRDLRGRPRQQHHRGRPRRPVRHRAAAPGQPGLDAASRRRKIGYPRHADWPMQYLSRQGPARAQPRARAADGGAGRRPVAAGERRRACHIGESKREPERAEPVDRGSDADSRRAVAGRRRIEGARRPPSGAQDLAAPAHLHARASRT